MVGIVGAVLALVVVVVHSRIVLIQRRREVSQARDEPRRIACRRGSDGFIPSFKQGALAGARIVGIAAEEMRCRMPGMMCDPV